MSEIKTMCSSTAPYELQASSFVEIRKTMRRDIVSMIHEAKSGHPGGSLSAVEIMAALYFTDIFRVDPKAPDNNDRDRFILSKGHCAPVLYSALCRKSFFSETELPKLRKLGAILQGHPHSILVPGLDCSSGSLGQGLSISCGIALGFKKQNMDKRVYCLMGDGEIQEGQIWEAAMTASQLKLDNICGIVDNNHVQLDGRTDDIKKVEPVAGKFRDFGWNVIEIDGHNVQAVYAAYKLAAQTKGRPTVIVAETIKGMGISYMEDDCAWHGMAPNSEQLAQALKDIDEMYGLEA